MKSRSKSFCRHLGLLAAACATLTYTHASAPAAKILYPADLGPTEIDVSHYPPEHQKTYREIFLEVFGFFGTAARVINSPLIEADPNLENVEKRNHPEFSDAQIAQFVPMGWKKRVEAIRLKPPCCGACPVLSLKEAKALRQFLVYDSLARKTGVNAGAWIKHRKNLNERFKKEYPDRFRELHANLNQN
ncbi:MAG: hypothetical protein HYT79_02825 [Elusimicrobia bacterium]|nr:hypothetical protein [Elusimicrobiota bacterium]